MFRTATESNPGSAVSMHVCSLALDLSSPELQHFRPHPGTKWKQKST